MKMSNAVEQSLVVLVMLALQKDELPIKSYLLSNRLEVSESYLKKTMRKLVVAGIVQAIASKEGGFKLARSIADITLLDVYEAIEGDGSFIHSTQLADRIFLNQASNKPVEDVQQALEVAVDDVLTVFNDAEADFKKRLQNYTIAKLLQHINVDEFGKIDWRQAMVR
ncbi:RrF2 family transcriptional regulator [Leuconostoc citreum]|uniref:RrF2 family transcriptional regulator n=1 Tax=Leuconostoc citreum TaxID=33964 RepID=UPI0021A5C5E6|nr:Rrf2 family transcriptional regulator [Leuconostoc citreum]MCT3058813.1 Rrf2 family transcriptional regulator [Leuconostoc citreum]MDM7641321.1 Rrf2 family transcriptional regulator [Leuconostoc citreum]MDY5161633.1 Rrf2 family transcriptional regulator [Leuconostoc citreum]MDY5165269.1 Rrf2 family transcriptional regulator [Leuconostoc citreum]